MSLEEYYKKHDTLGECKTNLTKSCKEATKSLPSAKYQDILRHLYNKVTEERNKQYKSLVKDMDAPERDQLEKVTSRRCKKELMNFMGSGLHHLCGV